MERRRILGLAGATAAGWMGGWTRMAFAAGASWRAATEAELMTVIPARAPVIKEHIETEFRTASGITDGQGRFVASVLLITAGYAADGKYSHYLLAQAPLQMGGGTGMALAAGEYLVGWRRGEDALEVEISEAATGRQLGRLAATRLAGSGRVESFRIWPPGEKGYVQIGRFALHYEIAG